VSEFTHDTADDGFHEIQLSGKQLVFLFIVTTTVIVVVFLCGVKVGRGARAAQGEDPEPAGVAATSSPSPAEPSPSGAPPGEPPAPAADMPPDLGYPDSLKDGSPPDAKLKPQPDSAPPPEAPAPAPSRPARATEAPKPAPAAESAGVPSSGRAGTWAVQVIATLDRNMATSIVKRLVAKDYPAFLVNPAGSGPAYYKVQVGRFNDRGEAEQVSQRIKKEEQFQSWITR
jgi:cell division septation protein DedD